MDRVDPQTLEAGWNIDLIIATKLGWVMERIGTEWRIKSPTGMKWGMREGEGTDYEKVWVYHWQLGNVLQFSTCTDDALALWHEVPDDYTPRLVRIVRPMGKMQFAFRATIMENLLDQIFEAEADTPALAICRAWLLYRDDAELD